MSVCADCHQGQLCRRYPQQQGGDLHEGGRGQLSVPAPDAKDQGMHYIIYTHTLEHIS